MRGRNAAIATIVGLVALSAVLGFYATRGQTPTAVSGSPNVAAQTGSPTATTAAPSVALTLTAQPSPATTAASPQSGAITGRLEYPGEAIPPLTVYAISTTDQRVWFSVDVPRFPPASPSTPLPQGTFRPGEEPRYVVTGVAPGTYYVLAYRNDGQRPDPGAYTRAVSCRGPQPLPPPPACNDHSLVPVTVTPGQTVSGIDVTDWVVQPPPSIPPRPAPR